MRRLAVVGPPFMEGSDVEAVQRALGVDPDQRYGTDTSDAVRAWKRRTGFPDRAIDGVLGIPGQRMLLGLDPVPPAFARRAAQRGSAASALDAFIVGRSWLVAGAHYAPRSPLEGFGTVFVEAGRRHGVDPRFLVAVATQEGRLGTYRPTARIFNTFGLGPGRTFDTWEANIEEAAMLLARPASQRGSYVGANTIGAIGTIWAPVHAANDPHGLNNSWVQGVTSFFASLGGANAGDALVKTAP